MNKTNKTNKSEEKNLSVGCFRALANLTFANRQWPIDYRESHLPSNPGEYSGRRKMVIEDMSIDKPESAM
jgi:hypothetical protein